MKNHADCSEKFSKEIYTHENTHHFTFFFKFTQASEKKIIHMELQFAFLRWKRHRFYRQLPVKDYFSVFVLNKIQIF